LIEVSATVRWKKKSTNMAIL